MKKDLIDITYEKNLVELCLCFIMYPNVWIKEES
jgi:hypothetical protein